MATTRQREWDFTEVSGNDDGIEQMLESIRQLADNPGDVSIVPLAEAHNSLMIEASLIAHNFGEIDRVTTQRLESRSAELRERSNAVVADLTQAKQAGVNYMQSMSIGSGSSTGGSANYASNAYQLRQQMSSAKNTYDNLAQQLQKVKLETDRVVPGVLAFATGFVALLIAWNGLNPFVGILGGLMVGGIVYTRYLGDLIEKREEEIVGQMSTSYGHLQAAISRANFLIQQEESTLQESMKADQQNRNEILARRNEYFARWREAFVPRVAQYRGLAHVAHPDFNSWTPETAEAYLANNGVPEGYESADEFRDLVLMEYNHWQSWTPPETVLPSATVGTTHVMVSKTMPENFRFQTSIALPSGMSQLIYATEGTTPIVDESIVMKLVTAFPPDRLRLTLIDPVGNGSNFAGLMHLGEHNPTLIGEAAWVDPRQIEEQLARLSEQMRTIIQKYLKRDFATMEEYNAQAVSIEEPYRLVVINNFPTGFSPNALSSLNHLIANGQRAGIYVMLATTWGGELPRGFTMAEIEAASASILHRVDLPEELGYGTYVTTIQKPEPAATALHAASMPSDEVLKKVMEQISDASLDAGVVQVPFAEVAPSANDWWSVSSKDSLSPVVGFHGARKPQHINFGRNALGGDLNNGALIVGRVGSGKSSLLHSIIMGLATQYSPEELELYLIDSKQGIEFNTYARYQLPHAKAISVETEPEFTASVILRLAEEMEIRARKFKDSLGESESARNISRYREVTGNSMPRIVLVIDEFQELYREESARIRSAQQALEQIIRQGRAYGIHLILATQTFGGGVGMPKSIRELVAVRISLMTSEADAAMIFQEDNTEARLLNRPGEAILNESFGRVESNQRFQTAWMESEERDQMLIELRKRADSSHLAEQKPIVFVGGVSSSIEANPSLAGATSPTAWFGSTIAIEPDFAVNIRQNSGANVLVVGKHEDTMGMVVSAATSMLATSNNAFMRIVDAGGEDTNVSDHFQALAESANADVRVVTQRAFAPILEEVQAELLRRLDMDSTRGLPPYYLVLPVIDRIRSIRRDPSSISSYSISEFNPVKAFGQILVEGAEVGIHVLAQSDSLGSLDKVLNAQAINQFDTRVVTQISSDDSTRLIDNREAGNLGPNRAIVFQDDRNSRVKIKPYGVPSVEWIRSTLASSTAENEEVIA